MSEREKLQAVEEYLKGAISGAKIDVQHQPQEGTYAFQILCQEKRYCAVMTEAFLNGREVSQIPAILNKFTLVEHLLALGATPVVVTPEGLALQGE